MNDVLGNPIDLGDKVLWGEAGQSAGFTKAIVIGFGQKTVRISAADANWNPRLPRWKGERPHSSVQPVNLVVVTKLVP